MLPLTLGMFMNRIWAENTRNLALGSNSFQYQSCSEYLVISILSNKYSRNSSTSLDLTPELEGPNLSTEENSCVWPWSMHVPLLRVMLSFPKSLSNSFSSHLLFLTTLCNSTSCCQCIFRVSLCLAWERWSWVEPASAGCHCRWDQIIIRSCGRHRGKE